MKTLSEVKAQIVRTQTDKWHAQDAGSTYAATIDTARELWTDGTFLKDPASSLVTLTTATDERYTINGACSCGNTDFAPGWCAHGMAVKLYSHVVKVIGERQHLTHSHFYTCYHLATVECWDKDCKMPKDVLCPDCEEVLAQPAPLPTDAVVIEDEPLPKAPKVPVEVTDIMTPAPEPAAPYLPEAGASLNLKIRLAGNHELMYTMRGHNDADLMARLPKVLASLERVIDPEGSPSGLVHGVTQAFITARLRKPTAKE